ncbi:hypothetical protein [Paenibacillus periandrae]|uniref:hypothetical protein n=1 Tax=Paenibacillus periandrae TaxID=1761741 RepID=UPI001F09B4B9|nr:hypothetical protein [Paenibacillus periandrae]
MHGTNQRIVPLGLFEKRRKTAELKHNREMIAINTGGDKLLQNVTKIELLCSGE